VPSYPQESLDVTDEEKRNLQIGNVVMDEDGVSYVVTEVNDGRVMVTRTVAIGNASRWTLESTQVRHGEIPSNGVISFTYAGER
jgi:hypothetical protein